MGVMGLPVSAEGWPRAVPQEVGLDPAVGERLQAGFAAGDFGGLHALLIARSGKLAVERYFDGPDQNWGRPLASPHHDATLFHDMRSVTKSIVGLLYGIAVAEGRVPKAHVKLAECYPDHAALMDERLRKRITIGHVLSMRMGIDWNEDLPYSDPNNGEIAMEAAPDRLAYILSRPMAEAPGSKWRYCGGATALVGDIIARGVGVTIEDYARDRLFAPLGIGDCEWVKGSDGTASASSGLRLKPRDILRMGQMVLQRGHFGGRRIVPPGWLATSFKPRGFVESGLRYGYHWWIGQLASTGKPWMAAYGNGGQRLIVIPSLDMVVAILAGNYNALDQWKLPLRVMTKIVMPAVAE